MSMIANQPFKVCWHEQPGTRAERSGRARAGGRDASTSIRLERDKCWARSIPTQWRVWLIWRQHWHIGTRNGRIRQRTQVVETRHPDALTAMTNLAHTWKSQGRDGDARAMI